MNKLKGKCIDWTGILKRSLNMKAFYIFLLILIPNISYAGNYSHSSPSGNQCSDTDTLPSPVAPVVPVHPVNPPQTSPNAPQSFNSVPSQEFNEVATPSTGGVNNGQIWCSSKTSPGYQVGLPYGGCANLTPPATTTIIRLSQLPDTGLTWWQDVLDFMLHA